MMRKTIFIYYFNRWKRFIEEKDDNMKSTKRHFTLEDGEYLITPNHYSSVKYKILFDGEKCMMQSE